MKYIGLLDCNNFFVSCERLFRPDLRNKPTLVLSSNDGCVVARSQEVKALGIPMGVPYFKIKKELEDANVAIFSGNIALYRDISARVMSVLKREFAVVEQYSIDESFFGIVAENDEDVHRILVKIKKKVEKEVGVPVSLGAGVTKTIAKYASEKEKRRIGVCALTGEAWEKETIGIPIQKIWGVGGKTEQKMHSLGIETVQDFLKLDVAIITKIFGTIGTRLMAELNEKPFYALGAKKELQKSMMSTRSSRETINDLTVLQDAVAYHVAHVAEELRGAGAVAQCIRILMQPSRYGDWILQGVSEETLLSAPTSDTRVFLREATCLVEKFYNKDVPYKKVGVILSQIISDELKQTSLFDEGKTQEDSDIVMETIDAINNRFGKGSVTFGQYNRTSEWKSSSSKISPHYTTKWEEIAVVNG